MIRLREMFWRTDLVVGKRISQQQLMVVEDRNGPIDFVSCRKILSDGS